MVKNILLILNIILFHSIGFAQTDTLSIDFTSTCKGGVASQVILDLYEADGTTLIEQAVINYTAGVPNAPVTGTNINWDGVFITNTLNGVTSFYSPEISVETGGELRMLATQIVVSCANGAYQLTSPISTTYFEVEGSEQIDYTVTFDYSKPDSVCIIQNGILGECIASDNFEPYVISNDTIGFVHCDILGRCDTVVINSSTGNTSVMSKTIDVDGAENWTHDDGTGNTETFCVGAKLQDHSGTIVNLDCTPTVLNEDFSLGDDTNTNTIGWGVSGAEFSDSAINGHTTETDRAVIVGQNSSAVGAYSIALQRDNQTVGDYTYASGRNNILLKVLSWSKGWNGNSDMIGSAMWGKNPTISDGGDTNKRYATCFGNFSTASGHLSTAFGEQTQAIDNQATSFGRFTQATSTNTTAFGNETVASGINATSFGNLSLASQNNATAFGNQSTASGQQSTAFGLSTQAVTANATAFGELTQANGVNSTATGRGTIASGTQSLSQGIDTEASGASSIAFGVNGLSSGTRAFTWGFTNQATSSDATAFGQNTVASATASLAHGRNSTATGNNSWASGEESNALHDYARVHNTNQGVPLSSTQPWEYLTSFRNGYQFFTDATNTVGATLAGGSTSWAAISARKYKDDFESIDYQNLYENFQNIEIEKWSYKGQDRKHIGIYAEDFYSLVGDLNTATDRIETVDADGLTLALIKAQADIIKNLEKRIHDLENK